MTTNAAFITAMQALAITGVKRHYDEPPNSIDLSGGYAAFPLMPDSAQGNLFTSCSDLSKRRSMLYVVITEAAGQSTQATKYAALGAVMDNLETAFDALRGVTGEFLNYTITTTGAYPIGQQLYWAVIGTVTIGDGPLG